MSFRGTVWYDLGQKFYVELENLIIYGVFYLKFFTYQGK